jgi:hypothetical protein
MSKRGSLVSSSDFDSIGRGKAGKSSSGGGGGNAQDKIKIAVAVGLLVVAGGLLAWHFGVIDTTPTPPPPSQEEIVQYEQRQQHIQQEIDAGRMAAPGAE